MKILQMWSEGVKRNAIVSMLIKLFTSACCEGVI